jgi:very-short-patch-repair endonuclease
MKQYRCKDCKKEVSDYRKIRCKKCNGKWLYKIGKLKVGKYDFDYNNGISKQKKNCKDCGKKLSDYRVKRCKSCATKYAFKNGTLNTKGKNHYRWSGGLPKCKICNKQLKNYNSILCCSCENKRKHKIGILNSHTSNYKNGHTLIKSNCISCGKELGNLAFYYKTKRCMKCTHKLLWKNIIYKNKRIKTMMQSVYMFPNKPESILINIFKELKLKFKYTGNGKRIIDGFCPDFINSKMKKIIEHNGDYWHKNKEVKLKDRRKLRAYKKHGYTTLIIWEHELKNIEKLITKIIKFNEE